MNKAQLIDVVQEFGYETKIGAERAVEAVLGAITEGLKSDGAVSLMGFGSWSVKQRAGRTGRNPQTGEPIYIAPSTTVSFKPGKGLKEEC